MATFDKQQAIKHGNRQNWFALNSLGADAWNYWVHSSARNLEIRSMQIDLDVGEYRSFENFEFPIPVSFQTDGNKRKFNLRFTGATFEQEVSFQGIITGHIAYFKNVTFKSYVDFSLSQFDNPVHFQRSKFLGKADFYGVKFNYRTYFEGCSFHGETIFQSAEFKNHAYFNQTTVLNSVNFSECSFDKKPFFNQAHFKSFIPNFSQTSFSANSTPDVDQMEVVYPRAKLYGWMFGITSQADASQCARKLKKFAVEAHDHESELRFFALELKAKRGTQYTYLNPLHLPALAYSHAYGLLSDFGQSIFRPLVGLLLTALLSYYSYANLLQPRSNISLEQLLSPRSEAVTATLLSLFPFAGQSAIGRDVISTTFCKALTNKTSVVIGEPTNVECLSKLYWISSVEGIFAFVFLFLFGLALRNRAKIK